MEVDTAQLEKITEREADYLVALYETSINRCSVSLSSLAKQLNVKSPTAIEMLKKLESKGLVKYLGRKGVKLTKKGVVSAEKIIRRHRLIETLLVEKLGLDVDTACCETKKFDSYVSFRVVELINYVLGNPVCCPHGKPIPPLRRGNK